MTSIPISVFSQNAAQYVAHAVNSQDVISVTTEKGSAVLLSAEEFRGMMGNDLSAQFRRNGGKSGGSEAHSHRGE